MVELLRQVEGVPAEYPDRAAWLSDAAAALDAAALWGRIEGYTAHRFAPRAIAWTIQGQAGDEWTPPLCPLVSHNAERWFDAAWVAVDIPTGPMGFILPSDGTFRITGQVGAGPLPPAVAEAFRRLAEYSAEIGSSADGFTAANDGEGSFERSATWAARSLQNSGAADLLRPYRRAV